MSEKKNNQPKARSGGYSPPKKDYNTPTLPKLGIYVAMILPAIFILLYTTGAWDLHFDGDGKLASDNLDSFAQMAAIFLGFILGPMCFWMINNSHEDKINDLS